jgi:hypothetical protein
MSAVPTEGLLQPLLACERAAGEYVTGRLAFTLWLIAQCVGWEQARTQLSKSAFYRQLAVLRKAGLQVPERKKVGRPLTALPASDQAQRSCSPFSQVFDLPGQRFTVTKALDDDWLQGHSGVVESVAFARCEWSVSIMREGDRCYTRVPLREFLRATAIHG